MTSSNILVRGLGVSFVSLLALVSVACGSSSTVAPATDGGSGSDTGTVATHPDSGVSTATEAGAGDAGDDGASGDAETGGADNHSFATATPVTVNGSPTSATLGGINTTDYYSFTAKAGERIYVAALAQALATGMGNGNDATIIDTVVTVYDSTMKQIAQDDDDWPRTGTDSALYFVAPADGTYYVTVQDCNGAFGPMNCAMASGVTTFDYQILVADVGKLSFPETTAASTQDGTTAKAQTLSYKLPMGGKAGQYSFDVVDGLFTAAGQTHVYSFTPPADTSVTAGQRAHAEFWVQPVGPNNGDGSTANVTMWVTDSSGTKIWSRADQANYKDGDNQTDGPLNLSVPVTLGQQYFLFIKSDATTSAPTTDYYFVEHFVGSYFYGDVEAEGATGTAMNDTMATAQKLATPMGGTAGTFFVDGDVATASDVDWYEVDPATTSKTAYLECSSARRGAGTQGFTATLYGADGTTVIGALGPEASPPAVDLYKSGLTLPASPTKAFLKVSATGQDATDLGTAYLCTVQYQ